MANTFPALSFDPGLTQQFGGRLRRTINKDGSFNVHRRGAGLHNFNLYQFLIDMAWPRFLGLVLFAYLAANVFFAVLYCLAGIQHLQGAHAGTHLQNFLSAFFFSVHTMTTVGYGNIVPEGFVVNCLVAIEAMVGLMGFALATSLLYGRMSRPSARIAFSESMLVAPYQGGTSLQFRIANQRTNMLMDIEAKVLLMTVEKSNGGELKRRYTDLRLERSSVYFLPLTWTIVHPIDESSPLAGKTEADLATLQAELLIRIKAFDDTFSQVVHVRYSYRYDEVVWGARFQQIFQPNEEGDLVLEIDRINELQPRSAEGMSL